MSKQPNLSTQHLATGYQKGSQKMTIHKDISIELHCGQLIGLIGVNGVGKSTLLRTLAQIQPALSGHIEINNRDISQLSAYELAQQISVVLTDGLPSSNLTVQELVALGRQPYTNWFGKLADNDKRIIDQAIALTEIDSIKHKRHDELSDGQLQRVLIARALAQDTPIILLDEPTTHLDLSYQVSLLKLLQQISHQENKCVVYATHDINTAIKITDQMIVLTPDKSIQDTIDNIVESGVLESLFNHPDIVFNSNQRTFEMK